jgi:DNA helicase HerA-like ATPase
MPPRTVTATSADGRTFSVIGSDEEGSPGEMVLIAPTGAEPLIGQFLNERGGLIVGPVPSAGGDRTEFEPFESATVEAATEDDLVALQAASGADLVVGTWTSGAVSVPACLRSQGFGRHTFLCGQSGSGKTYALGVLLEQLIVGTDVRMVVLDPNADFVHLNETREGTDQHHLERLTSTAVRVLGPDGSGAEPLRLRFATMPRPAQAAVMRLDPLADRAEYNSFLHMMESRRSNRPVDIFGLVAELKQGEPEERALAQRMENLELLGWQAWAYDSPSASEIVASGSRVTVLNLSGFTDPREASAIALDLIESLWAQRHTRTPTLIVIDEAHNLCPSHPTGPVQHALVDRLVQIAAEGRKYGLWLLLSTQRPSKIDAQVLSQCDNLMLMRMNSPGDVVELAEVFGFAPRRMIEQAPYFRRGEALVAGNFVPRPAHISLGARLTKEGGSDVNVPLPGG